MIRMKKMCAGYDGNSHLDYIYKNIDGKKYCKSCAHRLQPSKSLRKISDKQKFKIKLNKTTLALDKEFYLRIWYARFGRVEGSAEKLHLPVDNTEIKPRCECCMNRIFFQPTTTCFHHILEKSIFPAFRYLEENIAIVCDDCHSSYHSNPDTVPYLVERKKELIRVYKL